MTTAKGWLGWVQSRLIYCSQNGVAASWPNRVLSAGSKSLIFYSFIHIGYATTLIQDLQRSREGIGARAGAPREPPAHLPRNLRGEPRASRPGGERHPAGISAPGEHLPPCLREREGSLLLPSLPPPLLSPPSRCLQPQRRAGGSGGGRQSRPARRRQEGGRAVAAPQPHRPGPGSGRAAGRLRPALPWRGGSAPGKAALPVAPSRIAPS